MHEFDKIVDAIDSCEECENDDKCQKHRAMLEEARKLEHERADPENNRIGVRGDPVPDHEYGDNPEVL